jgi:chromate transport protein ChrA
MLKEFVQYSKETLLGVVLALGTALALSLLPGLMRLDAFAMLLVLIAAIYIGFALSDERPNIVRLEIAAAAVFVVLALLGLWVHPLALVASYVLHGVWDLVHHERGIPTQIVGWYPPVCVIYDWIIGLAGLAWYLSGAW